MAPLSLLGPPQLTQSTISTTRPQPTSGKPFIDSMVAEFNNLNKPTPPKPPMGFIENNSATYLSSCNPCLGHFFHVVPSTPSSYLHQQLPLAWAYDALTTLKLICNLRGIRDIGKSDKEGFYIAALWFHIHHPKTLACKRCLARRVRILQRPPGDSLPSFRRRRRPKEPEVRKNQKSEWQQRKHSIARKPSLAKTAKTKTLGVNRQEPKEVRKAKAAERVKAERESISALSHQKTLEMAKKAIERYERDPHYRFLYDRVSDLFAKCLKSDVESLNAKEYKKISLAAKWCPSTDSSFDRATLLCESIARNIYPRESYPEYEGIEDAHYVFRIQDRLRKEILVPLRKVLELPEVYIGANEWNSIPYNRVASLAMKIYKEKFLKHDEERFKKYLEDVEADKSKIAAGALLPHEIIASLKDSDGGQVAELQWQRMVEDMVKLGKMRNCLAVCDVSGSMSGEPMEVCVALGLLVSELCDEPWKGKVITFSQNPQLHLIQGESLESKTNFIRRMEWGMNTDFQKVFDLLLQVAVKGNLKPENMIKRIFVFSDMEFDQASTSITWETDYEVIQRKASTSITWETDNEVIQRKYREKGYGDAVPQIVFWNLRHSRSTPVPGTEPGVALLSGFSKNLLKLFLDYDGEIRPDLTMELAIAGPEYQKLVVLD